MKRRGILIALCAFATAFPSLSRAAQPEDKGGKPDSPGEVDGRRPRGGPGEGRRNPRDPAMQLAEMDERLKLDDAQKQDIGALLTAHNEKIRELRGQYRPTPEDNDAMRAIRDEMREARESGDQQKMAEIRDRIRAYREEREKKMQPVRDGIQKAETELHDAILTKLHDNQKEAFEDVWTDVMVPNARRPTSQYDPRLLRNVVTRLKDLSPEQSSTIDKLFEEFRSQERESRRRKGAGERETGKPQADQPTEGEKGVKKGRDRGREKGGNEAEQKLYNDVLAVLNETQRDEVKQIMERAGNRRGGRDGRGDPGRFRRPGERPLTPPDKGGKDDDDAGKGG